MRFSRNFYTRLVLAALACSATSAVAEEDAIFSREIAPILAKHCADCHGDDEPEAQLKLTTREGLLYGAASGRIVAPGAGEASLLLKLVAPGGKPHMPPEGQLSKDEIAALTRWIDQLPESALPARAAAGSADHWAYRPLAAPKPPEVRNQVWVRNAIDPFVLAKIEAAGLSPAPEASAAVLCRRVYFDLIGLPPTPAELQAFVARYEEDEFAYEHLVDQLLASPHYGERWGRHWLDLARYADSSGFHEDIDRPQAWRYRDYVIDSFNSDKPYGRFVKEQLAGDELAPDDPQAWVATGFCRNGPSNDTNMGDGLAKEKYRLDLLDDVIATSSAVFLGQTIGCARCHDHKFDPISQKNYYELLAIFDNTERVNVTLDDAGKIVRTSAVKAPAKPPENVEKPSPARDEFMVFTERNAAPRATRLLWRGDVANPGPAVSPGVPRALAHLPLQTPPGDQSAGRRLAWAEWVAAPGNPLTWRVAANRIWQHHFGVGLVATPSNFGSTGAKPTHPELLEWLAQELLRQDGRWKPLHREIVLSATYRQDSQNPAALAADPANNLLARHAPRRLEAEVLRDAILTASGALNPRTGGPGVKPRMRAELLVASQRNKWPEVKQEGPQHWRRSVYIYVKRQLPFPLLELFNAPSSAQTCERRDEGVAPTQALVLMNDEFTQEQSARLAQRVADEVGSDPEVQLAHAVLLTLSRRATRTELAEGAEFLAAQAADYGQNGARQALVDFCHVLLNSNEFAYIR